LCRLFTEELALKVVFCNPLPTSKIFGAKVDAWWYKSHGFDVEFWDMSPIFWPQEKLDIYYGGGDDYRYIGPGHQIFFSRTDVFNAMNALTKDVVIWPLSWGLNRISRDELWLRDMIVESKIPFFIQLFEVSPISSGFSRFIPWFRRMLARRDFYRKQPTGVIGCGSIGRSYAKQVFPDAMFISVPSPKVLWEKSEVKITSPYVVFVDENIEYDPDARMLGYVLSNDVDSYYQRMNALFQLIEDILKCPVIIAASGKYRYPEERFHGRLLIYGETLPLIQHARLVIGHCSGALDQAIVEKKPILQLDDQSFSEKKRQGIQWSLLFTGGSLIQSDDVECLSEYLSNFDFNDKKMIGIETMYFRETDVHDDYREIIKRAFLSAVAT